MISKVRQIHAIMISSGFTRLQADHCYYSKWFENSYIILLLYVDDMLVAGLSMKEILNFKAKLVKEFSMKDLSPTKKILGMRINREKRLLKISQAKYVKKVLKRFNVSDSKPVNVLLGGHSSSQRHML